MEEERGERGMGGRERGREGGVWEGEGREISLLVPVLWQGKPEPCVQQNETESALISEGEREKRKKRRRRRRRVNKLEYRVSPALLNHHYSCGDSAKMTKQKHTQTHTHIHTCTHTHTHNTQTHLYTN